MKNLSFEAGLYTLLEAKKRRIYKIIGGKVPKGNPAEHSGDPRPCARTVVESFAEDACRKAGQHGVA
jgi:hypothetical protein